MLLIFTFVSFVFDIIWAFSLPYFNAWFNFEIILEFNFSFTCLDNMWCLMVFLGLHRFSLKSLIFYWGFKRSFGSLKAITPIRINRLISSLWFTTGDSIDLFIFVKTLYISIVKMILLNWYHFYLLLLSLGLCQLTLYWFCPLPFIAHA